MPIKITGYQCNACGAIRVDHWTYLVVVKLEMTNQDNEKYNLEDAVFCDSICFTKWLYQRIEEKL